MKVYNVLIHKQDKNIKYLIISERKSSYRIQNIESKQVFVLSKESAKHNYIISFSYLLEKL